MFDQGKPSEEKLLTLGDLLKFLHRRRFIVLAAVAFCLLLGIVYSVGATRRYRAEALIEIKRPDDDLGLNNLVQGSAQGPSEDNPLAENVTLATKVQQLQSGKLGLRVINELGLESTYDFQPHVGLNPLSWIGKLFPAVSKDAPGTAFMDSPARRTAALNSFERHLKVEVVAGTRLISIAYESPDPQLATKVVDAMTEDLAQDNFQTRYGATNKLAQLLQDQLQPMLQNVQEMQQKESELRRDTETYNLGGTNAAGQQMVYSPLLDHLQQSTLSLSQAETSRILRSAVNQILQTRDPKMISGLAGSGLIGSGNPQSSDSLSVIRVLQGKLADQQLIYSQDSEKFGSANPKLAQEKAQLAGIEAELKDETDRLAERAANDLAIAVRGEKESRAAHDALIQKANVVNDKALEYQITRQEAEDARQLYTDLNRRLQGAGVTAGLRSADMTVVSGALTPSNPSSPRIPLILALSLVAGVLIGISIAIVVDVRDDKVNSVETVENELAIPVYSITPDFNSRGSVYGYGKQLYGRYGKRKKPVETAVEPTEVNPIHVVAEPDSQYSEAMRVLRTAILLSRPGASVRSILVTSSTPGEGKSTTSANLAATFARTGSRVLLVEVDLRKPVLARRVGLPNSINGLSRILTGQLDRNWFTQVDGVPNLYCIPAGQRPPDPHELISSELFRELVHEWKEKFDMVILDGPPVLPVIDSVTISEQTDLVLVITRFGKTSINSLRTTHRLLGRQVRANIGAVLNAVSQGTEGYYSYYGYRNNAYKYEGTEDV